MAGVFAANPLSLSVPEPALDSWMRENGYHELLDECSAAAASSSSSSSSSPTSSSSANQTRRARRRPVSSDSGLSGSNGGATPSTPSLLLRGALGRVGGSAFAGVVRTLLAVLTTNPFAKLAGEDFAGSTPPWTTGFLTNGGGGQASSYSWPAGPAQARMRVHENVKRYARNYACLWLLFFACTLYKMPLALLGVVSSLAIWEALRLGSSWWDLEERHPGVRFVLVRVAQIATAIILYYYNFHLAVVCAIIISYTVMILHASLRKLMSHKKPDGTSGYKRSHQNK